MTHWDRLVSPERARGVIIALGTFYVIFAIARELVYLNTDRPLSSLFVIGLFIGVPGFILIIGGYRLIQFDIRSEFYPTVAKWCLGGLVAMVGLLLTYHLIVSEISTPDRAIPILTVLSSAAGFGIGIHDAKARTRTLELRETINQLQASNERLEQFAYAASHDLQEPLRMVSSYLQLVEKRYSDDLDEDGQEFIDYAVDGADRMREMIDGLLEYSRVETQGEPFEPVDLDGVLEDVLQNLQVKIEETDAEITVDSLPCVEGDASQLRQVFQNLLSNAIEYSDERPQVYVSAERNGTNWIISVRDEGIGIEPNDQERIFEVFERVHSREDHPGSGIGLAVTNRIIERHHGKMWVESEPGEGSTFSFTLPANGEQPLSQSKNQ